MTLIGKKLEDKVAIITGGSSGIGRAISLAFSGEGAHVAVGDIIREPREGGRDTVSSINDSGKKAIFLNTNVSREDSVKNLIDKTVQEFGKIDIVVNSAGIPMQKSLADTSEEDFDRMYSITVKGTFLVSKHAIPYLLKSDNGKIINIASNFSHTALPNLSAYAASKAAIIGLTKALALEFGSYGINVNAICPGATKTEMSRPFWGTEEGFEFLKKKSPLVKNGRFLVLPEDVGKLAVFLASSDSDMITGESILIDSGWNAQ